MKKDKATIQDVLEAVNTFATKTEERFSKIETVIGDIKTEMTGIKTEMTGIKTEMTGIKSGTVTKDYLDTKLFKLKSDLVGPVKIEDKKVNGLVDTLRKKKILGEKEAHEIISVQPFASMS